MQDRDVPGIKKQLGGSHRVLRCPKTWAAMVLRQFVNTPHISNFWIAGRSKDKMRK